MASTMTAELVEWVLLTGSVLLVVGLELRQRRVRNRHREALHRARLAAMRRRALEHRGQAIVEFALVLPVFLFLVLGGLEAGLLLVAKADQDRHTDVLAHWLAEHPDQAPPDDVLVDVHLAPPCIVDGETDRVILTLRTRCAYHPQLTAGLHVFDNVVIGSEATALEEPTPTPAPSDDPSPAPSDAGQLAKQP